MTGNFYLTPSIFLVIFSMHKLLFLSFSLPLYRYSMFKLLSIKFSFHTTTTVLLSTNYLDLLNERSDDAKGPLFVVHVGRRSERSHAVQLQEGNTKGGNLRGKVDRKRKGTGKTGWKDDRKEAAGRKRGNK